MPDIICLANVMEAEGITKSEKVCVEDSAISTTEVIENELAEVPSLRSAKSILKSEASQQNGDRIKRTVSWHDFQGKDLHTVREFVPSEHDDDEVLCQPEEKGACCTIC